MSGTDETGANYILESFGMVAVEMETVDGQYVQLREGVTATLAVPVDNSLLGDAPSSIPLWHFDDIQHNWVKEGEAELVDGKYIGEVSHFSWWNCDDFAYAATLCVQIFDGRYQGSLEGIVVELTSESVGTSTGVTDTEGNVSGQIPAGEILQITVYDQCGEVVYTGTIGPFTGNDNKEIIPVVLNNVEIYAFSGTIFDCETMSPLDDAVISINVEGNTYYVATDDSGVYTMSLLICEEDAEYVVSAYSAGAGMAGAEEGIATLVGINVLNVNLCNETPFIVIFNDIGEVVWPYSGPWQLGVEGRRKPNETIIYSNYLDGPFVDDLSIGFSGTTIGSYPASVYSPVVFANNEVCTVNITQYESGIGGFIKGTIQGTNQSNETSFAGSFSLLIVE